MSKTRSGSFPAFNPSASGSFKGLSDGDEHLKALSQLLDQVSMDPTQLFDHCLNLLVQQLKAQRAMITRTTELGLEPFWWAHNPDDTMSGALEADAAGLSARVFEHPHRTLVVRNVSEDPQWKEDPDCRRLGLQAYLGAALHVNGQSEGILSAHFKEPRNFSSGEVALVNAVANLVGKTLEVEVLRSELRMTRDALELTSAVVEDSALQSPDTGLPNLHYLDIWLKANIHLARRKGEGLALLMWKSTKADLESKKLHKLAATLRGEDLLVDMGRTRLLAILPRTNMGGLLSLLDRIRPWVNGRHLAATLWDPKRDDPQLKRALSRVEKALAKEAAEPGIFWNLLPEPV